MYCTKCGKKIIDEKAVFCPHCGNKVIMSSDNTDSAVNNQQPLPPNYTSTQNNVVPSSTTPSAWYKKWWVWVIVSLVILVLILSLFSFSGNNKSTNGSGTNQSVSSVPLTSSKTIDSDNNDEFSKKANETTAPNPTQAQKQKQDKQIATDSIITNNSSAHGFWAEGSGDYVVDNLQVTDCAVLHLSYVGDNNFIVVLYNGNKRIHSIANVIGSYNGDVLVAGTGNYNLEIKSSGSWKITSDGLSIDDTTSFSGRGDSVTGITSKTGGSWHLTHNGDSNFIVVPYAPNGKRQSSIVNEIGSYDGTIKMPTGNLFFEIKADGDWTMNKE